MWFLSHRISPNFILLLILFLIEPLISLRHQHRCKDYYNLYVPAADQNFMLQFQLISPIFPLRFTNFTFRLIQETHFPTAVYSSHLHFQRLLLPQTLVLPTDTLLLFSQEGRGGGTCSAHEEYGIQGFGSTT